MGVGRAGESVELKDREGETAKFERREKTAVERDFATPRSDPAQRDSSLPGLAGETGKKIRMAAEEYDAYYSEDGPPASSAEKCPLLPPLFRADPTDFMTGGNRTHNRVAQYLTQEVLRILEQERGVCLDPAEVRRGVHDELARHKINDGREHNTNVLESSFSEIIDHVVAHFGGGVSGPVSRVIETSEDMHWRIEDLIESELATSEYATETLRATLRTRLRAEFSSVLMNEWGSERLEDISDFLWGGIVADFELRSLGIISETIAASAVCEAESDIALQGRN